MGEGQKKQEETRPFLDHPVNQSFIAFGPQTIHRQTMVSFEFTELIYLHMHRALPLFKLSHRIKHSIFVDISVFNSERRDGDKVSLLVGSMDEWKWSGMSAQKINCCTTVENEKKKNRSVKFKREQIDVE